MTEPKGAAIATAAPAETQALDAAVFPVFLLQTTVSRCAAEGIDPEALCRGLGFVVADLDDPACRVSFRQASRLIRRALQSRAGPGLGLRVGAVNSLGSLGLLGHAMSLCRTFAEAIQVGLQHQFSGGGLVELSGGLSGDELVIDLSFLFPDPEIRVFCVEEMLASCQVYCRTLLGPDFRFRSIELDYPAPPHADAYDDMLDAPVQFGCLHNRATMDASWLMHELPNHNPVALRQALNLLAADAVRPPRHDLAAAVERVLGRNLERGVALEDVAAEFNMSGRTLRRRLIAQGVSFDGLLDQVRHQRALELIRSGAYPVERIAAAVGYRDARSFRRAFKRWTGCNPSEFRR